MELAEDSKIDVIIYNHQGKRIYGKALQGPLVEPTKQSPKALQAYIAQSGQIYDSLARELHYAGANYGYVSVHISQDESFQQIIDHIKLLLAIAVAVVLLVIVISYSIINQFTKPIVDLVKATSAVAEGNLDYPIQVKGNDELALLASSFASMQEAVREKMQQLKQNLKIIEEKNLELKELDRLKDEFLANTSHELRSPLHGIIGIAEAMLMTKTEALSDNEKLHISMIISNGKRLNNLINDLIDFYKIQEFGIRLDKEPILLYPMIDAVLAFCSPMASKKSLVLKNQIPLEIPPIFADKARLEQILYNLVTNAIRFTQQGEIVVLGEQQNEQTLKISVMDTGVGIPTNRQKEIFDLFTQVKGPISAYRQGTGLGLSITKSLVELHGGELLLTSQEGKGSCFYFNIAIAQDYDPNELFSSEQDFLLENSTIEIGKRILQLPPSYDSLPSSARVRPKGKQEPFRILIVDDDPVNLETLKICLETEGYQIFLASSGEEALESIDLFIPDLVLLDVMMSGMNGFEVAGRIRQNWDLVTLPIVVLTAKSQLKDLEKGYLVGVNDYLTKPFHPKEIILRIHTLLLAKTEALHAQENQYLQKEILKRERLVQNLKASQQASPSATTQANWTDGTDDLDSLSLEKLTPSEALPLEPNEKQELLEKLRIASVDVMCCALECWEACTGKTKLDLAEESKIWHINIEDGCYRRTRTMDRYFSIRTLPKKPRLREVKRTAVFVLEQASIDSYKIALEEAFSRFQILYTQDQG